MNKQTIEIDCPDGMKPVWKNNKIEFVPIESKEMIRTVKDAYKKLGLRSPYLNFPSSLNLEKLVDLQVVLAALNGPDFKWNLTKEKVWYPWVRFVREDCLSQVMRNIEKVIGHFKYEGTCYALLGGDADSSGGYGLGNFVPQRNSVGDVCTDISLLSCKDEATARYVSEHFGKLVFEATVAFKLKGIEWL